MIQPSGDYSVNHVWHCCHSTFPLQTVYLRSKKKKEQWLAASLDGPHGFMLFAICTRGETSLQPSSVGPLKEARQGGDQKVRYSLCAEVEINASLSRKTDLFRLWVPGTSISPFR